MQLAGKRVVVTGGASGIGRATALAMAQVGARVTLADRDEAGGAEACEAVRSAGGEAVFSAFDLTDHASIRALADEVIGRDGAPHALINAAGWDRVEPFVENTTDFMEQVIRLNLLGTAVVTQAFLPALIQAGRGKLVNVASDAGRVGSSGETIYAGAKGGIIAFTKSLAREMASHGITANCVCPGPTDTPLFRTLPEKLQQSLTRAIPLRRLARPEEIADAILFFASPRSDFVTGQVLSVSGGLTMAG